MKKSYAIPVLKVMEGLFLLIKLNFLMLLTTLLGIVIFGFFPSLNAAITVTKTWLAGESDKPFVKTYMESFKKNFLRSNMYGWLCFIPLIVLVANFYLVLVIQNLPFRLLFLVLTLLLLMLVLVAGIFILPFSNGHLLPVMEMIKRSSSIGFANLPLTFLCLVGIVAILAVSIRIPTVLLTMAASLIALWLAVISEMTQKRLLNKMEVME